LILRFSLAYKFGSRSFRLRRELDSEDDIGNLGMFDIAYSLVALVASVVVYSQIR